MKPNMKLFSNSTKKNAIVENPSFESELNDIKAVFSTAINRGKTLIGKMQAKKDDITSQINALNAEMSSISAVQEDAAKFVKNLEGLV